MISFLLYESLNWNGNNIIAHSRQHKSFKQTHQNSNFSLLWNFYSFAIALFALDRQTMLLWKIHISSILWIICMVEASTHNCERKKSTIFFTLNSFFLDGPPPSFPLSLNSRFRSFVNSCLVSARSRNKLIAREVSKLLDEKGERDGWAGEC